MTEPTNQVLFLCTGNYYRSRFAEALFNYRTTTELLAWSAFREVSPWNVA